MWIKSACQQFQESWDSTEIALQAAGLVAAHLILTPTSWWVGGHQCTLHPDNDLAQELKEAAGFIGWEPSLAATEQVMGGGRWHA